MVLLIIIPIKWLFHWEYTIFSDKPKNDNLNGECHGESDGKLITESIRKDHGAKCGVPHFQTPIGQMVVTRRLVLEEHAS